MICTLLHHQRAADEYSLVTNKDITERWKWPTVFLIHKREFVSWWKQLESTFMLKRGTRTHVEKRNAVFPVKRERVGATEVLVIELIDYTIQDSTQAKNCITGSLTTSSRWLNTVRFWDGFWQRLKTCACLELVGWLVELKRKTMIIQVFQEAVQHFFLFIFSV